MCKETRIFHKIPLIESGLDERAHLNGIKEKHASGEAKALLYEGNGKRER